LDGHDIEELYEYTLHLSEACDKHLSFADTRLREVAAGLSTLLHGTLREIDQ
jgi:hypothetical protein